MLQPHSGPACGLAPTPLPNSSPLKLSINIRKELNGVKETTLGQNGYVKVHYGEPLRSPKGLLFSPSH